MQASGSALALLLQSQLRSLAYAILVFAALFLVIATLEKLQGADVSKYRTRNFANDAVYGLFYQGGIYNVLLWAPLAAALEPYVGFARLELLGRLPLPIAYVLYWVGMDFVGYWTHRLQHAVPALWAFHSVHHSQERLSFMSTNRFHLVDIVFANLMVLVPVAVFGIPTGIWMPFYFALQFLEYFQHAELHWRYGPLYRWIVSPDFHAIHHARELERRDRNFGKLLSAWDFAFGTADSGARPLRYGVAGLRMPENLWQQLVWPFRSLAERRATGREAREIVAPLQRGP